MTETAHPPLKDLNDRLVAAAEQPAAGDEVAWLERVRDAARALYDAIETHRHEAEDDAGTLHDATRRKPGLMSVSNRLEHEHADMLHRANEIDVETSRQLDFQEYNVELVRLEAQVLAGVLLLHIFRTDRMIYEAYFRIEGGEGGG